MEMISFYKLSLVLAATLFAGSLHASELLKNGDFTRGTGSWKGDRKIVDVSANKALQVDLDRRKDRVFLQDKLNAKNVRNVKLSFRYRTSEDYEGSGITLRFVRPKSGSTFRTVRLQPSTGWQTYTWDFNNSRDADELTLQVEVHEGTGYIQFDDFSAISH